MQLSEWSFIMQSMQSINEDVLTGTCNKFGFEPHSNIYLGRSNLLKEIPFIYLPF